jgi:flagella basal body P-ring formation protein FlgA
MRLLFLFAFFVLSFLSPAMAGQTVVKEAEVRRVITEYLQQKSDNLGLELSVRKIGYRGDLSLPAGAVSYEVVAPDRWEGWGNGNLALLVRVDDRLERNVPIPVEVEALAEMVVAVRPLDRGEIISPSDVAVQKRTLSRNQGKLLTNIEEAVGKRTRLAIRGNNPIRADHLERVPLVKSGQMVTIIAENEALRISAPGKARSSGAEGDRVMVQNLSSHKEIPARVVDAATVKVDF